MQELLQKIYEYLATNSLNLLYALVILIVGRWISVLAGKLTEKALAGTKVDVTLHKFVAGLVRTALFIFVIVAVLEKLGIKTTSFVAILGAAGLAVGLALQGSLANFAAGILLTIFRPFRVGDFVEIAGTKGIVRHIEIFNTILDSPDNLRIIIPNAQVTGGNIVNYTVNGTRRVDMVFGVSYDDDLKKAREVIQQVIAADTRIFSDPAPVVAVSALADSSVNFVVRPWVNATDYWGVYFDLTEQIKVALEKNGLTIPYPQQDVYVKQMAAAQAL
ncbi:MAG: mechanosensitive ion channel [Sedimentisphaerales bacterium]|nr:mechanosensitive ion channel [Sedimentisphaerales bacterium]